MNDIRLNISFRNTKNWKDSGKRSDHILDRMQLRGISHENIIDAVKKGAKNMREDGSITVEFRWFKVVYREFRIKEIRKIYPITVIEV